jgi:hypothetical protein
MASFCMPGLHEHRPEQAESGRAAMAEAVARAGGRPVTQLATQGNHRPDVDFHRHPVAKLPGQGDCALGVAPWLWKFGKTLTARVRQG